MKLHRCMALLLLEEAGAQPAFSSPMEATDRAVISHTGMPSGYLMVNIDHRNENGIARQREPAGPPSAL